MKSFLRSRAGAALAVSALVVLSGCGGGSEGTSGAAAGRLSPINPTSYVTMIPETTTTTLAPPPAASTTAAPSADQAAASAQTYTVAEGDGIYAIAEKFNITPEALVSFNQWPDVNHVITPGQVIKLPPNASASDSSSGSNDQSSQSGDCPSTYTIQAGDTSRIKVASKFNITYQEMDAANTATPGYSSFLVGAKITIPCPTG